MMFMMLMMVVAGVLYCFRDGNSDDNDLDWRMVIVMSVIVIFSSTAGC